MNEVIVASKNQGKINEFRQMLEPKGYLVKSLLDIDESIEIEETGKTFHENAIIKAKTISDFFHVIAISDDSGLEIDAFGGEPGVYSARYLGYDTSYDYKNQEILKRMEKETNRSCRYICAIAWVEPNQEPVVFEDTLEAEIAYEPKGQNGFGYDPIIYYPPLKQTVAEMTPEVKKEISHRGKALRKLEEWCNEHGKTL